MASLGLASIRGDLYADAARLAKAQMAEHLAGREARDTQRDAAAQQARQLEMAAQEYMREQPLREAEYLERLRKQEELAKLGKKADKLRPDLAKAHRSRKAGERVLKELYGAETVYDVETDAQGNITAYWFEGPQGPQKIAPDTMAVEAAALFQTPAQRGQSVIQSRKARAERQLKALQTAYDRQEDALERSQKLEEATSNAYTDIGDLLYRQAGYVQKTDEYTKEKYWEKDGQRPSEEARRAIEADRVDAFNLWRDTARRTRTAPSAEATVLGMQTERAAAQAASEERKARLQTELQDIAKQFAPQTGTATPLGAAPALVSGIPATIGPEQATFGSELQRSLESTAQNRQRIADALTRRSGVPAPAVPVRPVRGEYPLF